MNTDYIVRPSQPIRDIRQKSSARGNKITITGRVLPPLRDIHRSATERHKLTRDDYMVLLNELRSRVTPQSLKIPVCYDHKLNEKLDGHVTTVTGDPERGVYIDMEINLEGHPNGRQVRDKLLGGHYGQLSLSHYPKYDYVNGAYIPIHEIREVSLVHIGARPKCYIGKLSVETPVDASAESTEKSTSSDISNLLELFDNPLGVCISRSGEISYGWFHERPTMSSSKSVNASVQFSNNLSTAEAAAGGGGMGKDAAAASSAPPSTGGHEQEQGTGASEYKPGFSDSNSAGQGQGQGQGQANANQDGSSVDADEPGAKRARQQPLGGQQAMTDEGEDDQADTWHTLGAAIPEDIRRRAGTNSTDLRQIVTSMKGVLDKQEQELRQFREAERKKQEEEEATRREEAKTQYKDAVVEAGYLVPRAEQLRQNNVLDVETFRQYVEPLRQLLPVNASASAIDSDEVPDQRKIVNLQTCTGALRHIVNAVEATEARFMSKKQREQQNQALARSLRDRMSSSGMNSKWEAQARQASSVPQATSSPPSSYMGGASAMAGAGGSGSGSGAVEPVNASYMAFDRMNVMGDGSHDDSESVNTGLIFLPAEQAAKFDLNDRWLKDPRQPINASSDPDAETEYIPLQFDENVNDVVACMSKHEFAKLVDSISQLGK